MLVSSCSQLHDEAAPEEFHHHEARPSIAGKRRHGTSLQVALLGQPDTAVNRERLADLLALQGEFPSKYRPLIWEFLLQLPRNSAAYQVTPALDLLWSQHELCHDLCHVSQAYSKLILFLHLTAWDHHVLKGWLLFWAGS